MAEYRPIGLDVPNLGPTKEIVDPVPQYRQLALMERQQNNADMRAQQEQAKFAQDQELQQQAQRNQATANDIFSRMGINRDAVNEYVKLTGDAETAQSMLKKLDEEDKISLETKNLMQTHQKNFMENSELEDKLVRGSQQTLSSVIQPTISGIDINKLTTDPKLLDAWKSDPKTKAAWALAKKMAPLVYSKDAEGNISRGVQLGEEPDPVAFNNFVNSATEYGKLREYEQQDILNRQKDEEAEALKEENALKREDNAIKREEQRRLRDLQGIDPDTGKPYTESRYKAAATAVSLYNANKNIDKTIEEGFDPGSLTSMILAKFEKSKKIKFVDFLNFARNDVERRYLQAQLDFMMPDLRDQSGAAINADEYVDEVNRFFPVTNESPGTGGYKQKRDARLRVISTKKTMAGTLFEKMMADYEKEKAENPEPTPNTGTKKSQAITDKDKSAIDALFGGGK
jgi:hypothetical protein